MTEGTDRDDWSLEELLEAWRDGLQDELHTALPARVDSYDAGTQKAVVTPQVRRTLVAEDGTTTTEPLPAIRAVPVLVPRGGDYFGPHLPLAAGDFVLLVVAERDLSRWLQTGEVSPAPDVRMHHLAHAIALPGLFPNARALSGLSSSDMQLGREGGPVLTVTSSQIQVGGTTALAEHPGLDAHLDAIAADLDAINLAIPTMASVLPAARGYGTSKKALLDVSNPIATTITKGD